MKHPVEADLALFAGGDLSFVSEWRIGRHVARCPQCRGSVEAFESLRIETGALGELPSGLAWNRLASEMKANIRLGLSAGECVAGHPGFAERPALAGFSGYQTLLAYAGVMVLVVAGLWLQRPAPPLAGSLENGRTVLAATRDGVELSEAGSSFGLQYGASRDVNYSVDAKGAMGARYVDTSTGYVTVVNVNVE
jgi:hypothetical protein